MFSLCDVKARLSPEDGAASQFHDAKTKVKAYLGVIQSLVEGPTQRHISLEEFQGDHKGRVWVSWEGGVYDMTDFLSAHPGGPARIEMVDGQDLSPFWAVYKIHERPHIRALMARFQIGLLSPEDYQKVKSETFFDDQYLNDPQRVKIEGERIVSEKPWNAEPPLKELQKHYITPTELFFVRNHNPGKELAARVCAYAFHLQCVCECARACVSCDGAAPTPPSPPDVCVCVQCPRLTRRPGRSPWILVRHWVSRQRKPSPCQKSDSFPATRSCQSCSAQGIDRGISSSQTDPSMWRLAGRTEHSVMRAGLVSASSM